MPNHVAVNPTDHRDTRILESRNAMAGDGVMSCVTFPDEFRSVQAHYPILFQLDRERSAFRCVAIFGFEAGENLFLKDDRWDARYIPLAADVQPFSIGVPKDGMGDRKVVLDLDNPRVTTGQGNRLFDDAGLATPFLEGMSRKLSGLDQGYQKAGGFVDALRQHDLLEPLTLDITLADGSENRLLGFHIIHEERLAELDAETLKSLQSKGYLQAIYMAIASISNFAELIDRKNAQIRHDI